MIKPNSKFGFTLIELLVVISIIAILAGFGTARYLTAERQVRDTQRKSDLNQYRIGLESYAGANNGTYPGYGTTAITRVAISSICSALSPYMSATCLSDSRPHGACTTSDTSNPGRIYCYIDNGTATAGSADYMVYGGLEAGGWWVICSNGKSGKVSTLPSSASPFTCAVP